MATIEQRLDALERAIRNSRITPQLPALINVDGDELINLWSFSQNKLVQYPYADVLASGSVDPTNDILPIFKQMPNPDFSLDIPTQIASYINNETDFTKTGSQLMFYFVTRKIVNADSDSGFDFQREFYLLAKGKGTYGATSGVTILSEEVVKQTPNIDASGSIQQINLNATAPYQIETVVNSSTAFTPIPSATILFNIAVGGDNEYYLYQGSTTDEMGTGGYVSVASDYINLQTASGDPFVNPSGGITNISYRTINVSETFIEGGAANILGFNISINEGELVDLLINVLENNVVTQNRYRIPLGAGAYLPLSSAITFNDLILIEKKPLGTNPSGSNTVTYVATDLTAINASDPALDLTNANLIYFIDLDDGFYRFVGTNGLYGLAELQMFRDDLEEVSQAVENPQPVIGTPPTSGTFSVDLSNFFGVDYSGTLTSLANFNIASGAILGGFARIKGNWATEPTVTGATQATNNAFTANVDLYMYFEKWDSGIIYWFDLS